MEGEFFKATGNVLLPELSDGYLAVYFVLFFKF